MEAKKRLQVLKKAWHGCTRCDLHQQREGGSIAFGGGDPEADILVVAAAPTADDMNRHYALSGDMGEVFDKLVTTAGLDPSKMYKTSLTACFSYTVIPETESTPASVKQQEPTKEQVSSCLPRLLEIIYTVDPKLIVAVGEGPFKILVRGKDRGRDNNTISKAHTKLFVARIPGRIRDVIYPVLALVPPEHIIANPSVAKHAPIATSTAALLDAKRYLNWLKRSEKT